MEYATLVEQVSLLPRQFRAKLAADLLANLEKEENEPLAQLLPVSNSTLAIAGHNLDMQIIDTKGVRRSIYDHLAIFREHLLNAHVNNRELIKALPALREKIKKLKLYTPTPSPKEQSKNIKDRTIFTGDQEGNQEGSTKTGVSDLTYLRNESFTQNVPVKKIIGEIQEYGLKEGDAVKLFVVIAGLPKAGCQDSDGNWYDVGRCGFFAFSAALDDEVEHLCFLNSFASLSKSSADHGFLSFSS